MVKNGGGKTPRDSAASKSGAADSILNAVEDSSSTTEKTASNEDVKGSQKVEKRSASKRINASADAKDSEKREDNRESSATDYAKNEDADEADCESDDDQEQQNANDAASDQSHNDPGKMFIGGLSWQTSAEGLRDYFCKFGEVNECMVMRDPATKRARGFGFITFADPASVEQVLAQESHQLDGKKIDPKVAFPKRQQPKMVVKTKKVFIGGLASTSTLEDMTHYFQQYGKIEDAMLMFDKTTQRHRGFGFITFSDDDISDKVCEIHFHEINGKMVECKKAQPKEVMLPVQMNKSRAAAARNFYGIAPEQLLAYASYMPNMARLAPYNNPGVLYPTTLFNGFPQSFGLSATSSRNTSGSHGPLNGGGNSSALSGNSAGLINPRNLAAVQLAAQQQAVYEAAMAYATSMGSLGGGGAGTSGTNVGDNGGDGTTSSGNSAHLHPTTVAAAAAAAAVAAAAASNQHPHQSHHHQQMQHQPQRQSHQAPVVTTHHHHLQHPQLPSHHMNTVPAPSHHHQSHQQQPQLHHHQHSARSGMGMQHHHQMHQHHATIGSQHGQQQHQRAPLLPGHYSHKM